MAEEKAQEGNTTYFSEFSSDELDAKLKRKDEDGRTLLHVAAAADDHPQVSFVIPHFGAGFFRETLMAGRQAQNVCVDTSSSNGWLSTQPEKLPPFRPRTSS